MDQRISNNPAGRDIPSFIEQPPPLILHPFMIPHPEKCINLMEKFEECSVSEAEENELLKVYLRIKQCNEISNMYEITSDRCLVTSGDMATTAYGRHNKKMYTFTHIFKPESTQKEIFDKVVKENLNKLIDGYSFTLLTYGASGSGKTYTVMGSVKRPGLVPRALEYLFKLVDAAQTPTFKPTENGTDHLKYAQQELELQWVKRYRQETAPISDSSYRRMSVNLNDFTGSNLDLANKIKYYVWVSFVEIYNENIYDLLADKRTNLRLREDSSGNVYVKGVIQRFVRSGEEAYDVMMAGRENRVEAATGIHAHSSRSHCIFTITMLTETDGEIRTSQVRLCDLAGSERQAAAGNTGTRMQESRSINSSLHVLERCLHMLRRKQRLARGQVPYRESKLTRLLGAGLSGARGEAVSMVVTLNPAHKHAHETKHVLALAAVAKTIQMNTTMASTSSSLESSAQESSNRGGEELRLRTDNERLHYELLQAQNYIEKLQASIEEKQQETETIMLDIVSNTKASTKLFYEKRLAAAQSQLEETIEDYESRLAEKEEIIKKLTRELKEIKSHAQIHMGDREEKTNEFTENYEETEEELQSLDTAQNINRAVSSDSELESDDESLLPVTRRTKNSINQSLLSVLRKRPPTIDAVIELDQSNEEDNSNTDDENDKYKALNNKESIENDDRTSKDSLYATGEESEIDTHTDSDNLTEHLPETTYDNTNEVTASSHAQESVIKDFEDKSECERSFNVSTKLDLTKEDTVNLVPSGTYFVDNEFNATQNYYNLRGTYFVNKECDGNRDDTMDSVPSAVRGTYFVNVPEESTIELEMKTVNKLRGSFEADRETSFHEKVVVTNDSTKDRAIIIKQKECLNNESDATKDDTMASVPSAVRGTYFVNVPEENTIELEMKTVNKLRGSFEADRETSFYNNVDLTNDSSKDKATAITFKESSKLTENAPIRIEKSPTKFVEPKAVNKLIKSLKTRQSSNSSLNQFEQMENAIINDENSPKSSENFNITGNLPIFNKNKRYIFDDSLRVEVSGATDDYDEKTDGKNNAEKSNKLFDYMPDVSKLDLKCSGKLCIVSAAAKAQEKLLYGTPENTLTSLKNQEQSKSSRHGTDKKTNNSCSLKVNEEKFYFDKSDQVIHKDVLLAKSPSSDYKNFEYEPGIAVKKILGDSFTKPESARKIVPLKKHDSVDIFESPQVNIVKSKNKEEIVSNNAKPDTDLVRNNDNLTVDQPFANVGENIAKIARKYINIMTETTKSNITIKQEEVTLERTSFTEGSVTESPKQYFHKDEGKLAEDTPFAKVNKNNVGIAREFYNTKDQKLETYNKEQEVTSEKTSFNTYSVIEGTKQNSNEVEGKSNFNNDDKTIKIDPPLDEMNNSKGSNNTVDEFEKLVKDLSNVRATEFELLVSQTDNRNDTKTKDGEEEKKNVNAEMTERTKKFEETKYNLRNKGKSLKLNSSEDKNTDEAEKNSDGEKVKTFTKRTLRLRRRRNQNCNTDQDDERKLKDIVNLEKEFSDVTRGVPPVKKVVHDIPSPEKLAGEEENVPPMMGIQSCPSKSVTRSRRKLFTPRAEPLEESPSQVGDSTERVCVPRPSYHRARARRKL